MSDRSTQTVLTTGANSGLGLATVVHLAHLGFRSVGSVRSAASTLILLDEDRREGRVHEGDLLAFLWIGAGNGAMNGYAAMVL